MTSTFSPNDNYIIVNYHYIRNPSPKWKGIFSCSPKEFEKQVKFLSENYKIVSVPDVFSAAQQQSSGKFCALTFDDGLNDHYENALPILKKYNATGIFFIITSTFDGIVPLAHKIHFLLSKFRAEQLIDTFNTWADGKYFIPKDKKLDIRRVYGNLLTNNFKETMISISPDVRNKFLNFCFQNQQMNESELNRILFMDSKTLKELVSSGMEIGNHSHSHFSYESLDEGVARADVRLSREKLSELLGKEILLYSYPHGRTTSQSVKIVRKEGFKYGCTIDKRKVESSDDALLIPRYDTNNVRDYLDSL